jgi:hypothetical protein
VLIAGTFFTTIADSEGDWNLPICSVKAVPNPPGGGKDDEDGNSQGGNGQDGNSQGGNEDGNSQGGSKPPSPPASESAETPCPLEPGTQIAIVAGQLNPTPFTTTFTLAPPPTFTVESRANHVTIKLWGLPESTIQLIDNNQLAREIVLGPEGTASLQLTLKTGGHTFQVRYQEGERRGVTSAPQTINVR